MEQTATRTRITVRYDAGYEQIMLTDNREWARDMQHDLRAREGVVDATIDTPDVVVVELPSFFYDDHCERQLDSGHVMKRLATRTRVALDRETYDEILSDARYYADGAEGGLDYSEGGSFMRGLVASARAVVRRLDAAEPPKRKPRWSFAPGKHVLELDDGEATWNPASTKNMIHGPARIEYRVWDDGGIDFVVLDRHQLAD